MACLELMGVPAVVIGRGHGRDTGGRAVVKVDARMHPQIERYLKDTTYELFLDRLYLNYPSSRISLFGQMSNP